MPIMSGISPMPPRSSTLPKVKRGIPAGFPRPTAAIRRPSISETKPLSGRSDVMNTAQVNPRSTSQKYSNELNLSAKSASVGAASISTAVPKRPPTAERDYWDGVLRRVGLPRDTLRFLALSLDGAGRPIPVVSTDPATLLVLEPLAAERARAIVDPILRPYPI